WMAEADALITRLGDDDFDVRYEAMLNLKSMCIPSVQQGDFIRNQLNKAIARTRDAEIILRASEVLQAHDAFLKHHDEPIPEPAFRFRRRRRFQWRGIVSIKPCLTARTTLHPSNNPIPSNTQLPGSARIP